MNSSFYNGISGVKTHQFGLDVWANNISNISTIGFRSSTPEFSSLFSTTLSGSYFDPTSNDKGLGSQSQTTGLNLSQGILENTDNPFDLAVNGEGWFAVRGQEGQLFYTRAGEFSIDKNGNLVDVNGHYLMATSGGNITPTTLDQATMDSFGQYYNSLSSNPAKPFAISMLGDVALGSVGQQKEVTLPDYLYFPPEATSNLSYGANLDPTVSIGPIQIELNALDYPSTVTASGLGLVDISGTISNTSEILDPKAGDVILITLTDALGSSHSISTPLSSSLTWTVNNYDVSDLNLSAPLNVSVRIQTEQELANVEHFTTGIIAPDGDRDIVDMTFTKVIPQPTSGSTWDGVVKVLSFYEDYVVEKYDSTQTYDPALYDVDIAHGIVKKIYDPALYYVNTKSNQVYEIIDTQTGQVSFGGAGQLLDNTIPTLSNGGVPLTLDLGKPNSYTGLISSTTIEKSNVVTSNGYIEGFLTGYGMDGNGNVIAEFSNGRSSAVAKVALYHFQNDQGLTQATSTYFIPSANSGNPIFYANDDGETFLGSKIYSNKLEGSNVSYATALTELIIMQKAFDASAKSITTSDQMIQNAINMKK